MCQSKLTEAIRHRVVRIQTSYQQNRSTNLLPQCPKHIFRSSKSQIYHSVCPNHSKTMTCQLWLQKKGHKYFKLDLVIYYKSTYVSTSLRISIGNVTTIVWPTTTNITPFCACWHICMSTTLAPRHIDLLPILPGSSPNVSLPPAPDETSASSEAII